MKTRFDLEEEIMKLYVFVDNIDDAIAYLVDTDVDPKVIDTVTNILTGTSTLMGIHAEKMLDTMSQCFKLDQYREDTTSELAVKTDTDKDDTTIVSNEEITHYWLRTAGNSDYPILDPNTPPLTTGGGFPRNYLTKPGQKCKKICGSKCKNDSTSNHDPKLPPCK